MRLDFNILWLEDNVKTVKTQKNEIAEYLQEKGFKCDDDTIKFYQSSEEIDYENLKDYDLILVDFNLDKGDFGDIAIKQFRENGVLTEIIFYSSNYSDMLNRLKYRICGCLHEREKDEECKQDSIPVDTHLIQGIYTSHRDELSDIVDHVIDTLIKKVEDLNTIRGLMMSETSELDELIKDKVREYAQLVGPMDIYESFKEQLSSALANIDSLNRNMDDKELDDIYKNHRLSITMIYRSLQEQLGSSSGIESYETDVIHLRNMLAHSVVETDKHGNQILRGHNKKPFTFNHEECVKIRSMLRHYKEIIQKIEFI